MDSETKGGLYKDAFVQVLLSAEEELCKVKSDDFWVDISAK